ncbi:hypothetical protein F5Y03DRAFT_4722 [Xylaria venustula]|nr:hypothetical protein F5Y03DRAFT_4722 [Xylaria venustula]
MFAYLSLYLSLSLSLLFAAARLCRRLLPFPATTCAGSYTHDSSSSTLTTHPLLHNLRAGASSTKSPPRIASPRHRLCFNLLRTSVLLSACAPIAWPFDVVPQAHRRSKNTSPPPLSS